MDLIVKESDKLVYVGKIISIDLIEGADFISSATVVCGSGGKWRGIVKKDQFEIGDLCNVYLPDALIPPNEAMQFMESSGWRVRMRRFRGAPSEVVIMPMPKPYQEGMKVGDDLTLWFGVTKYNKPISAHLQGIAKGQFPGFIPKTDEPNYQRNPELVDFLVGKPWYMTEKADGSSTTAFKWKGEFGICSRNLELVKNLDNGYWKIAERYQLEAKLPENIAIQWETCGPKIQSNPMGLKDLEAFMFSAYNIKEQRYLEFDELEYLSRKIQFPMVKVLDQGFYFNKEGVDLLGEGLYANGKQREGVVVRSQHNEGHGPISFKVINLNFEK